MTSDNNFSDPVKLTSTVLIVFCFMLLKISILVLFFTEPFPEYSVFYGMQISALLPEHSFMP